MARLRVQTELHYTAGVVGFGGVKRGGSDGPMFGQAVMGESRSWGMGLRPQRQRACGWWRRSRETHKLHAQESSIGRERVTGKAGDRCSTEGWRKTRCLRTALEICLSSASKREREANMGDVSNCDKPEEKQTSWEERGVETCPSEQESKRRFRPRKTVSPCLRARQFL